MDNSSSVVSEASPVASQAARRKRHIYEFSGFVYEDEDKVRDGLESLAAGTA